MSWFKRNKKQKKRHPKAKRPKGRGRIPLRKRFSIWMERVSASFGWVRVFLKVGGPIAAAFVLAWGATMVGAESGLFKAAEVEVKGLNRVDRDGLLQRAGLNPAPNLLALGLNELASRLTSEPWVRQVKLERRLPNHLLVVVVEREPVAVVTSSMSQGPTSVLVDEEGVVLKAAGDEDRRRYPVIKGARGPLPSPGSRYDDHAVVSGLAVLQATKDLPLVGRKSLAVIECTYPGRIILRGRRSHAVVAVRGGDLERKFARLRTLAEELKRRHGSIEYIDLSFEQRVIIKGVDKDT